MELVESWNREFGSAYEINEAQVLWNLHSQNSIPYALETHAGVSTLVVTGPRRRLALWGAVPAGSEARFVRAINVAAVGGDEFHFVPGVPMTKAGERLVSALGDIGFKGSEVSDIRVDLDKAAVQRVIGARLKEGESLITAETHQELNDLGAFLAREFPGRWHREFEFWRSRNDTRCAWWLSLQVAGEVIGFARVAKRPAADSDWRPGALKLGRDCDACLGPIGVGLSQRGKGTGRRLLGQGLASLHSRGARRVCIDWTDVLGFYRELEFTEIRRFWLARRV